MVRPNTRRRLSLQSDWLDRELKEFQLGICHFLNCVKALKIRPKGPSIQLRLEREKKNAQNDRNECRKDSHCGHCYRQFIIFYFFFYHQAEILIPNFIFFF